MKGGECQVEGIMIINGVNFKQRNSALRLHQNISSLTTDTMEVPNYSHIIFSTLQAQLMSDCSSRWRRAVYRSSEIICISYDCTIHLTL